VRQLFLLCFFFPLFSAAQFKLNVNWQLSDNQNEQWHDIGQITTVQADLEKFGMITNPYFGNNEERCQWVANKDWKYRSKKFQISALDAQKDHVDLVFREVDTFADIYFNGTLVLSTNNYFRTYRADVKALLEPTGNEIEIVFKSPLRTGNELLLSQKHPLPGEAIRAVARKPQYHYGWDWGPKITTMGLGQDVEIHPWNDSRIENLTIETLAIGDSAKLKMTAVVINDEDTDGSWSVAVNGNGQVISLGNAVKLNAGKQVITVDITIPNPHLWWPNGSGDAFLYDVQFKLSSGRDKWLRTQKMGIRTVEFIHDDDSVGQRFGFRVNGKDVFMRGANYIPQELIYHVDPKKELDLLEKAADVNMNMLRVWGGGKYESDRFYERCDSLGLLIWQDFMFACAMYPGDPEFLANVKIEAEEQVSRLSKHACLALWCGNNESSEGWERWGWKSGLNKKEEKAIADSYNRLFNELLPSCVTANDDAAYWESSPLLGRGDQRFKLRGDAHDWGIWHDGFSFDSLETRVPRFMSEFGFQSFPDPATMKMFGKPSDWDSTHVDFKNHEKHPRGFGIVSTYMRREYPEVSDFNHWLYLSQLVQRDGIVSGIRAHRQNEPYCMGTLFWQFNDCWPAASWSSVDYYNREKALHFGLLNAYAPIAVWTEIGDSLVVHLSNQTGKKKACKLKIEDIDMSGSKHVIIEVEESDLAEGSSTISFPKPVGSLLRITWECNGKTYTDRVVLNPKNYGEIIDPDYTIVAVEGRFDITITAWGLTRDLRISTTVDGSFSDNYITLLPRESRTLSFYPNTEVDTIPLTFLSLGKVFN
jgi:beta-mannosidase